MNYALVGAFVLLLGSLLVAGVLWLASGGAWQKKYALYQAVLAESVAGLNLNAPVKYNGVDVGKVQAIQLDSSNPQNVNLLFAIEEGTPIKEDTLAVLKTQGLTGIAYVELSGGSLASPVLLAKAGARYPVIRSSPSLSARLENVLSSVLAKLDSTSTNLNAILSKDNQAAFHTMLTDMATITRTLAARKDSIDAALVDGARTMKNASVASAGLQDLVQRLARSADAVALMGTEVAKTSTGAGQTIGAVGADVQRFGAETLPELQRLLAELSNLSRSLTELTEQTRRNPSGLIFGHPAVVNGPGESGDTP
ncbi:MlaD family protein [Rhodoferax sp. U11-2br]|uniref:MlaD family protein n=1 Tax=Rhodoferax sp. U11-2br TaxID=2838878 RepID=UPI001BE9ADB6|nr:MCE family protein [Rhodoferax sp. U11-2br]